MRKMLLTVVYKNGNTISDFINYLHYGDGAISYTVDSKAHSAVQAPVKIELEHIERYDVEIL